MFAPMGDADLGAGDAIDDVRETVTSPGSA
jgi:hypothetical protein